jgi:Reverse transcriptase (RNA-dependent DNA polymerase)
MYNGHLGIAKEAYDIPMKKDAKPYYAKPFPIPKIHEPVLRKEIDRLCKLGVISPSNHSSWGAPTFIIPKKDGRVRIVTDYRRLNTQIQRQLFPIPKVANLLHEIGQPKFMSNIDLNMGYYQIPLDEESKDITTFTLPWGKFRYERLPMGILTAPDEFQLRMNQMLGAENQIMVYLDDILIHTETTILHASIGQDPYDIGGQWIYNQW